MTPTKREKLRNLKVYFSFLNQIKFSKFLIAGLPAAILAIPLNFFFVTSLEWGKSFSYALILIGQVTLNFFMCRRFVFDNSSKNSSFKQFSRFFIVILFFRALDWGLYTFLVTFFGFYFLKIQIMNVVLFAFLKFIFSQRIMESG